MDALVIIIGTITCTTFNFNWLACETVGAGLADIALVAADSVPVSMASVRIEVGSLVAEVVVALAVELAVEPEFELLLVLVFVLELVLALALASVLAVELSAAPPAVAAV